MSVLQLIAGALRLRTETFTWLRERSDAFYRGFLVLLVAGLLAGAFAAAVPQIQAAARPVSEEQITREITSNFGNMSSAPGAVRAMIEAYVRESVAMGFEIRRLPPNAGPAFEPVARALDWLGRTLATPVSFGFAGLLLLAGGLVQILSRGLGGRAELSQMLGLTALAWAPRVFNPISSLLELGQGLTGSGLLGGLNSLLGLVLFIWGAAIFVKGTAVAQQFSYGKAIGAILLAVLVALALMVLLACLFGGLIVSFLVPVSSSISR